MRCSQLWVHSRINIDFPLRRNGGSDPHSDAGAGVNCTGIDHVGGTVPNLATPGLTVNAWTVNKVESNRIVIVALLPYSRPASRNHIAVRGYSSNRYRSLASGNPLLENARAAGPHTGEKSAAVVVGALRSELQYRIEVVPCAVHSVNLVR